MKTTLTDDFQAKLTRFVDMFRKESNARLAREFPSLPPEEIKTKIGKKYVNVDRRNAGVYMVVIETGEIFGIKGYGVIHRGHYYGTLDTIADFDWSDYRAVPVGSQYVRGQIYAPTGAPVGAGGSA
jgi:hypothetical protein